VAEGCSSHFQPSLSASEADGDDGDDDDVPAGSAGFQPEAAFARVALELWQLLMRFLATKESSAEDLAESGRNAMRKKLGKQEEL